jgi:hypothetical protein
MDLSGRCFEASFLLFAYDFFNEHECLHMFGSWQQQKMQQNEIFLK